MYYCGPKSCIGKRISVLKDEFRCCFNNIFGFFSGVDDLVDDEEGKALLESQNSANSDLESGGNLDSELSMLMMPVLVDQQPTRAM